MELRTLGYFVAVAEELHYGRAAERLHMSQPPLSRAIQRLERELGTTLLHRSPAGVALTGAGTVLLAEARILLERADRLRVQVARAAGAVSVTVGMLGDSHDPGAARLATTFGEQHPDVDVRLRETDLSDPTCGLRAGLVDVAVTRGPFDETGLEVRTLRSDAVGAVLRDDDPLAGRSALALADLEQRTWFRLPDGTDARWQDYWGGGRRREGPVVRVVQECLQAVLWGGQVGLAPVVGAGHPPSARLVVVPVTDLPPSPVVVAWRRGDPHPVLPSFVRIAVEAYR